MTNSQYCKLTQDILDKIKAKGMDEGDILLIDSQEKEVEIRLGEIEKLQHSRSKALGLRVFKDYSTALSYTSDFSEAMIDRMVDNCCEMVRFTSKDKYRSLPKESEQGFYDGEMRLYDSTLSDLTIEKKIEIAKSVEQHAMDYDERINNSDGSWWYDTESFVLLANTNGYLESYQTTSCGMGVSVIVELNKIKQRDYWYSSRRCYDSLEDAKYIGEKASKRALSKINAKKVKTRKVPVVFDPEMGSDLLNIIFSAINGYNIYKNSSFLCGMLGQKVGSEHLNVVDDALLIDGNGSRPFDGEGVEAKTTNVIENGVLQTYLYDTYSSKKLGFTTTGNAGRGVSSSPHVTYSNLYLKAGNVSPDDIISDVTDGLYLTKLFWVGINTVTGDYSRGAEGIWIENGKLSFPVQEITINSNMKDIMNNICVVGNDLDFRKSVNSPTFMVKEMLVSGE